MSEEEFRASLESSIPRHAAIRVEEGRWIEAESLAASRHEFAQVVPQGRDTPNRHFCTIVDDGTGSRVGETWYSVVPQGGKAQFWVDWMWIDPEFRRQGYATQALRLLETEAERRGADRLGLSVRVANEGAVALYSRLGYAASNLHLWKMLRPASEP